MRLRRDENRCKKAKKSSVFRNKLSAFIVDFLLSCNINEVVFITCTKTRSEDMNKIICINPPKFIKAILRLFSKKKNSDKKE